MDRAAIWGLCKANSSRPRKEDDQNLKPHHSEGDSASSRLQDPSLDCIQPSTQKELQKPGAGVLGRGCLILRGSGPKPGPFPFLCFCLLGVLIAQSPATPQQQRGPQVPKALRPGSFLSNQRSWRRWKSHWSFLSWSSSCLVTDVS